MDNLVKIINSAILKLLNSKGDHFRKVIKMFAKTVGIKKKPYKKSLKKLNKSVIKKILQNTSEKKIKNLSDSINRVLSKEFKDQLKKDGDFIPEEFIVAFFSEIVKSYIKKNKNKIDF